MSSSTINNTSTKHNKFYWERDFQIQMLASVLIRSMNMLVQYPKFQKSIERYLKSFNIKRNLKRLSKLTKSQSIIIGYQIHIISPSYRCSMLESGFVILFWARTCLVALVDCTRTNQYPREFLKRFYSIQTKQN